MIYIPLQEIAKRVITALPMRVPALQQMVSLEIDVQQVTTVLQGQMLPSPVLMVCDSICSHFQILVLQTTSKTVLKLEK